MLSLNKGARHRHRQSSRETRISQRLGFLKSRVFLSLFASLLSLVTFGSWAVGSSVGSSPDDQVHMASIWCSGFAGEECEVIEETGERLIPAGLKDAMCTTQNPFQSAGCQPLLNLQDPPMVPTVDVNTVTGAYPPGFYMTMNLFVQDDIERAITTMRFVNGALFTLIALILWWSVPARIQQPLLWGWLFTLTPLGFFMISSVNPSSWAIMSVGFGWLALLGFLETTDLRKATALTATYAITAVMAFSSRTDSAVFFILTSLLAVFLARGNWRKILRRLWLPLIPLTIAVSNVAFRGVNDVGQLGVIAEGFGSRTVSRYGEPLPWAKGANAEPTGDFDWNLLWNNIWDIPGLWLGFVGGYPFGSLGWLDTLLPQFVPFSLMFVISAIAFTGLQNSAWRKRVAIVGIILGAWVLPVYLLQLGGFIAGEEFQPRYLLPIFTVLVAVTLLRDDESPPIPWGLFRLVALWVPLSVAFSISLHTGIRRYTTGFGLGGLDLDAQREWWWMFLPTFASANTVWAIGSISFALLAALIIFRANSHRGTLAVSSEEKGIPSRLA